MTWPAVDKYLKDSDVIVIPIGSIEQHGPTGLLGTDAMCPTIIAEKAAESVDVMVAPTFAVGCAQHHMAFAGSMALRPTTMIAAMVDWVDSLTRHGFRHLYWLNGHGGNTPVIQSAFAEVHARRSLATAGTVPAVKLQSKGWWDFEPVAALCERLYPKGHGSHATPSEIAVTMTRHEVSATAEGIVGPAIAPNGPISDAIAYRETFPDGRIGSNPLLANVEDGHRIVEVAADCVAKDLARFGRPGGAARP